MEDFGRFLNTTVLNAQDVYSKKEKAAWAKFDAVRNTKYEGKGSRAIKHAAIAEARDALKIELNAIDDEYARAVGAIA